MSVRVCFCLYWLVTCSFNNISVISWWLVFIGGGHWVPAEKHRSLAMIGIRTHNFIAKVVVKPWGGLGCSGSVSSSWFTSGTRRVAPVTIPVISHEWGNVSNIHLRKCYSATNNTNDGAYNGRPRVTTPHQNI
jgi:hypothetical protein